MTLRYPLKRREIFGEFKKCFRKDYSENKESLTSKHIKKNKREDHFYIIICVIKERMKNFHYLCNIKFTRMEDINRLKVVLAEKKRTNKWLAEQMGVNPTTVSKWCTNSSQPDLGNLLRIADLLEVDIKELFIREYKQFLLSQELEKTNIGE